MDESASDRVRPTDRVQPPRGTDTGQGQRIELSKEEGFVGDTIEIRGRGLSENKQFEVQWNTVQGEWGVVEADEIVGPQYRPRTETIATVETGDSGAFDTEWTIPEDYGGKHVIEIVDTHGDTVAETEFEITAWFELQETTATLGDSFTLRGYGIGPDIMMNNYPVVWDNGYVGFMTGVVNRGTATAEIRAVGPPGKHVIQVWRSHEGIPMLQNDTQSPLGPVAGGRQRAWTVEITEPTEPPRTAWMDPLLEEGPIDIHYPELHMDTKSELDITPKCGQPGTEATISGSEFPARTEVDLMWYRHDGHEPQGYRQPPSQTVTAQRKSDALPTVTTDSDGSFEVDVTIPESVGSTKPITAEVDGREVAVTGFMMQPKIEKFEPTSGPVGTEFDIEISGVGWTTYEIKPMFVYDNNLLGYTCSLSGPERTRIQTTLRATGEPGYHFIDAYPSMHPVKDDEPDFALKPHLSYLDNHPVRPLPAFHFAFEVTE